MAELVFRALIIATLAWWGVILCLARVRKALWPRYRFSQLAWNLRDVLFVWLIFFVSMTASAMLLPQPKGGVSKTSVALERRSATNEPQNHGEHEASRHVHWVLLLIRGDRSLGTLALCLVATGILAPIVEEILFRGLLQGWCHTVELQSRRNRPTARRIWGRIPVGAISIGMVALLFAAAHYRPNPLPPAHEAIKIMVARQAIAYLLFLVVVLAVVVIRNPSRWARLFFDRRWFVNDLVLGAGWFLAALIPLYLVQGFLKSVLPEQTPADPFTMVLVGAILGILFARTGRLTASIVFHVLLNVTSLPLALLL